MDNPFLKRLQDGSISNEEELKALFRKSAKDLHPDTSPFTRDSAAFTRLNAHYEEALVWFRQQQGTVPGPAVHEASRQAGSPAAHVSPQAKPAHQADPAGQEVHAARRDPLAARYDFYLALQNLVARTWPFTRGREARDASLGRHIETAARAWDEWQHAEAGLFARLEACRREKLSVPGGPGTSDESVWQAVEAFFFIAAGAGIETSPLNRGLLDHQYREVQMKLKRRLGTSDVSRLVGMVMEDLSSRIPA